ncbi:MAG: GlsB/YeaQ/YmgE family stress response membrane protein [Planctomycetota bacterium]|nr:GlsB/YeaQ/YmgE family stress response membrane protein [Planctomycetota bacterium]
MDTSVVQNFAQTGLLWVGFGVVAGLTAKAILPGRDPGGAVVTFVIGILGSLIGVAVYSWASGNQIHNPISLVGFVAAVAGALVLLVSHRLLGGRLLRGDRDYVNEVVVSRPVVAQRRRRKAGSVL